VARAHHGQRLMVHTLARIDITLWALVGQTYKWPGAQLKDSSVADYGREAVAAGLRGR
jgi:hypothetical protein